VIHKHTLGRANRDYADRTACVSGAVRWTFGELHQRVGKIAAALRAHGLARGDRLALLLPNGVEYIELTYACAWLGVTAVPLNTRLSVVEIDRILVDAEPRGLIRHSSLPTPAVAVPWQVVLDHDSLLGDADGPEPIDDPDATLALVYTSGTTGHPKGVVVTHANMLANVDHVLYWMPREERWVYLHVAPMFHILDLPFMFASPALGSCQVTIPKFSPRAFCEAVERERVTRTTMVPTMIAVLTEFPAVGQYDLTSLRAIAYGGAPIAPTLIRRVRAALPHTKLQQGYGMSEAGYLTVLQDDEHTDARLTSCGRTCPGIDLRVVDEIGREVPVGQSGELVARGGNVMSGYWNNAEETARTFRNGYLRTGDVGYRDAEDFFFILDRIKDMIVTGGENVYSGEVEAVLLEHAAVREAAVFGVPDEKWGEIVAACIVLAPGQIVSADDLIAFCRRSLGHYKVPRRVEFSETELPKNAAGKVLKRLLRERFGAHEPRAVS
jgi:acyl-CoA synthetase (AMP-forming)/AMP-acid ligase II